MHDIIFVSLIALLWTAPENIQYPYPKKSKEGDIYSFGIILAEIINRSQGFASFKNYTSRGKSLFLDIFVSFNNLYEV